MYHDHFGLREAPFLITPHADFFFGGANRSALLDALAYALAREEGLVKVSGEVGTGKTMLARVLIGRLPPQLRAIYLADPLMDRRELLAVLADELGCADRAGDTPHRLLRAVQEALVADFASGRQVVLLIDEAHAMPADTLEQIRLLSNLESERHKLIKIALFGQPELDVLLDRPDMRQLKDRITQHFRLDPLEPDDVAAYIDFRLRAAGYRGPVLFGHAAAARIARDSGGLTRRINVLADKALLSAYARSAHSVTAADAQRAAADTQTRADRLAGRRPPDSGRLALSALVACVLVGAGYLLGRHLPGDAGTRPHMSPAPEPAAAIAASAPPVETQASSPAVREPAAETSHPTPTEDALEALLARSREWTGTAPGERWFIQLMSVPANRADHVPDYVRRAGRAIDPQQLRAYRTDTPAGAQIAVIWGDFADRRSALRAVDELPGWIASARPIPRQLRSLRTDG